MSLTDPDHLFTVELRPRGMARGFYNNVKDPLIISPHGHCEPRWFTENRWFPNPAELLFMPAYCLFRLLTNQAIELTNFGIPRSNGGVTKQKPGLIWHGTHSFATADGTGRLSPPTGEMPPLTRTSLVLPTLLPLIAKSPERSHQAGLAIWQNLSALAGRASRMLSRWHTT